MDVFTFKQKVEFNNGIRQVDEMLPLLKSVDPVSYDFILSSFTKLVTKHNSNILLTTSDISPVKRYLNRIYGVPSVEIKEVIFNNPATIVKWTDGTKTVVKCQPGDDYNKETGLAMCIAKKYLGNKGNFNEVFKKYIEGYDPRGK